MALLEAITGEGALVQASVSSREYTVGESDDFAVYVEVTKSSSRVWTGLSKAAADAAVAQNAQPNPPAVSSWQAILEDPVMESYTVQVATEETTTNLVRTGGA